MLCNICKLKLKLCKNKPRTAIYQGELYFDYYHCFKCKTNYAYPKKQKKRKKIIL